MGGRFVFGKTPARNKLLNDAQTSSRTDPLHGGGRGCEGRAIPAHVCRKPGQTRDDLFKINAGIAKEAMHAPASPDSARHCVWGKVVEACAKYCPNAAGPPVVSRLLDADVFDAGSSRRVLFTAEGQSAKLDVDRASKVIALIVNPVNSAAWR